MTKSRSIKKKKKHEHQNNAFIIMENTKGNLKRE